MVTRRNVLTINAPTCSGCGHQTGRPYTDTGQPLTTDSPATKKNTAKYGQKKGKKKRKLKTNAPDDSCDCEVCRVIKEKWPEKMSRNDDADPPGYRPANTQPEETTMSRPKLFDDDDDELAGYRPGPNANTRPKPEPIPVQTIDWSELSPLGGGGVTTNASEEPAADGDGLMTNERADGDGIPETTIDWQQLSAFGRKR